MGRKQSSLGGSVNHGAVPATVGLLALFVAGTAFCFALTSPRSPWLVCPSLLSLFLAIRLLSPIRAMLCGALWGAVFGAVSFFSASSCLAPSATDVILLTLVPALYTLGGSLITRWAGFSPLALATGWIAVELALQPLGLRGGLFAGAVADGAIFQVVGGLFGYVFIAFGVAYLSAWLLEIATSPGLWQVRPLRPVIPHDPYCLLVYRAVCRSPLFAVCISQPRAPPV